MSENRRDLAIEIDAKLSGNSIRNNDSLASEIDRKLGRGNSDSLISSCNENASLIDLERYSNNKASNKKNKENSND